jgi:hypothetical protein
MSKQNQPQLTLNDSELKTEATIWDNNHGGLSAINHSNGSSYQAVGLEVVESTPIIEVSLAETRISLTNGRAHWDHEEQKPRVIFRLENKGSGPAHWVNIRFYAPGRTFSGQKRHFELRPGEAVEDYFELELGLENNPPRFEYLLSYYDPDGKGVDSPSQQALHVLPLIDTPALDLLRRRNPFTGKEVNDERMFVGRDQLLQELSSIAIDHPHGSLLMLYGQKLVGKSSLAQFLEREVDQVGTDKQLLAVYVNWLLLRLCRARADQSDCSSNSDQIP